jgi:hypothetical protein
MLVATQRAVDAGRMDLAARCTIAALFVFDVRGPASRGGDAATRVLGAPGVPPPLEPRPKRARPRRRP